MDAAMQHLLDHVALDRLPDIGRAAIAVYLTRQSLDVTKRLERSNQVGPGATADAHAAVLTAEQAWAHLIQEAVEDAKQRVAGEADASPTPSSSNAGNGEAGPTSEPATTEPVGTDDAGTDSAR